MSQRFLEALFPDLGGSFIELRLIKGPHQVKMSFHPTVSEFLQAVPKTLSEQDGHNVYFGACPRARQEGNKQAVERVWCLWVDMDAKMFPGGKPEALKRLKEFPLAPTAITDSGNGHHGYWRLKEPEAVSDLKDVARIEAYLKALASALGGDPQAAELARVMRVPGTFNVKIPTEPLPATLVSLDPDRTYNLSDFEVLLDIPSGTHVSQGNDTGWIAESLKSLQPGNRNSTFAKLIGRLHHNGWSAQDILTLLVPHAERVQFPVEELRREIEGLCRRYPTAQKFLLVSSLWPDSPHEAVYHGLAGEIVKAIEPHSEADPMALLGQFLVAFSNVIGHGPHFIVEATRHALNLFLILVGLSSKGRKGSALEQSLRPLRTIDPPWGEAGVASGLSSGEGLIWAVRDPIYKVKKGKAELEDEGVADKRLLVLESEFASTLRVMGRDGSTLSPVVRQFWDSGNVRALTKNSPARTTGAHVSVIGHITKGELLRHLDNTEAANGFGNRFLWACVKRSKCLPEGGQIQTVNFAPFVQRLKQAVEFACTVGEMKRDEEARKVWWEVYPQLSQGQTGLFGAVTSRAEAQVMRIACLYALLELSHLVRAESLKAALALWEYCEASARYIFGQSLGDPAADEILRALNTSREGLTRSDLQDLFGRNRKSEEIGRALGILVEHGLVRREERRTGGRPEERWFTASASTK